MKSGENLVMQSSPTPQPKETTDDTNIGVIYIMTEIEPAYYLVVSQLLVQKDLRQAT